MVTSRVLQVSQAGLRLFPLSTPGGGAAGSLQDTCIDAANMQRMPRDTTTAYHSSNLRNILAS